jgi:ubiquinone/menaquinone biosynthesis C-methylase UbiE
MASVERTEDRSTTGKRAPALAEVVVRPGPPARFDRVARLYRLMEYLSFGPMLERCRFHHIPALTNSRRALVFGDGDGRFLSRLLAAAPHLRTDAVDGSSAMLRLLRKRVALQCDCDRLTLTCTDARIFKPHSAGYDLVVTHFFLDCLSEGETHRLIARVRPHLAPGARWLVSEFQIPNAGVLQRGLARTVISGLYAAFRLLTGLAVRRIPGWPAILARHGFRRKATRFWLGGLLVSELWEIPEQPRSLHRPPTEK